MDGGVGLQESRADGGGSVNWDDLNSNWENDNWGDLDNWLAEGTHEPSGESGMMARHRWTVTSAGHVHDSGIYHHRHVNWKALAATPRLEQNLERLGFDKPSAPQVAAFGPIMRGSNVLLADSNGKGKTLAFVAPLVQRLWEWEEADGPTPRGQVRAVVIVPTNDLAQQVLSLARDVAHRSIRASIATGEHSWKTQRDRPGGGLELLVCTMGRLVAHLSPRGMAPSFSLEGTRLLVADEATSIYQGRAPTWLDRQRRRESEDGRDAGVLMQEPPFAMWKWLRSEMAREAPDAATVLVTSTLPEGVEEQMRDDVADLVSRVGRGLHTTAAGIDITLVDCSLPDFANERGRRGFFEQKVEEALATVAAATHALIICNSAATADRIGQALARDQGRGPSDGGAAPEVYVFHGSLTASRRAAALAAFRRADDAGGASRGRARVMVATGRAVRGLDLAASPSRSLDEVVLFDFPPDARAYLSRVGCARRGARPPADVTALVGSSQLAFARALLAHDRDGAPHIVHGDGSMAPEGLTI